MKVKLRDYAQLINSRVGIEEADDSNYISTDNMLPNRGGIKFGESNLPKVKTVNDYQKGDILISNIRPYFKKIWFSDRKGTRSGDVLCFRVKDASLINKYLYCVLQSDQFFNYVVSTSKGTKMPRGDKKVILDYEFELPDKEEQRKKYNPIMLMERKLSLNNQINDNLLELANKIFSKFLDVKNTELKSISDVANVKAGGDKPKNISSVSTNMHSVPIFSNGISNNGLYGYTNEPKINQKAVTVSARGTIGFVCLRETPYYPIVRLISVIPKGNITHRYLYLWLRKNNIQGYGTTQQQLTVPVFKKYPISILSDKNDIDELNEFINPIFNKIQQNNIENRKLVSIKKLMLKKYF